MLAGVAVGIFPDFSVAKERARYVELLEPEDRKVVLEAFVPDLIAPDRPFRPGLRVKGVAAHPRVFEMTSDNDGRTTFTYGPNAYPASRTSSGGGSEPTPSSPRRPAHETRRLSFAKIIPARSRS